MSGSSQVGNGVASDYEDLHEPLVDRPVSVASSGVFSDEALEEDMVSLYLTKLLDRVLVETRDEPSERQLTSLSN